MLARACLIRGGTLVARLHDREVSIKAPSRFLQALFRWCDGNRTIAEIAVLAEAKWPGSRFHEFVRAMLECGVLADARFALVEMLDDVRRRRENLASPHGAGTVSALDSNECLPTQSPADISLGPSHKTHARAETGGTPNADALCEVLKELRAVSSGMASTNAQPLQAVVLLRDAVEGIGRAVYHVIFSGQNVLLRSAAPLDTGRLLRVSVSPYAVSQCMGALAVLAGGRLSSEQATYPADLALVAAGAAIERMRSRAECLELPWQSTPVQDADDLRAMCGVEHGALADMILFGKTRSLSTEERSPARSGIDLRWIGANTDLLGYHVAEACVHSDNKLEPGWGRSTDAQLACAKAVSEAVERHAFRHPPENLCCAPGRKLASKLEPTAIVRFSDDQYRRERDALSPYDDDAERLWVAGKEWDSGDELWIPADCVYNGTDLPAVHRSRMLMRQTSSGCASDTSLTTARERAGLEVVERDAFARHWLAQHPGVVLAGGSLPTSLSLRIDAIKERALEIDLCVLQGNLGPVVLVMLTSALKGFCVAATACGNSAHHSVERALAEAELAAVARSARTHVKRLAARSVRRPIDHADLYGQRRHYRKAHAISRGSQVVDFGALEKNWPASLSDRLGRTSGTPRAAWVDMTRSDSPLSLDGLPIHTVRVLIPGAIPIGFGYDALPRGMSAASVPSGSFPHPLP